MTARTKAAISFRDARARDLPAIVAMLADDALGKGRETPQSPEIYSLAFGRMEGDCNTRVIVAEQAGAIVGSYQINFIQGLSRGGARRALVEAVRTRTDLRSQGIGEAMMRHAAEVARKAGCAILQLTSDKSRSRAHAFYLRLGFAKSHEGFKLDLQ